MSTSNLEVEDGDFGVSGRILPLDAGRAIYELTNEAVDISFEQAGNYADSEEISEADTNRYVKQMLSSEPDTLEEKFDADLDSLFYTDQRESDCRAQILSTSLPRPDHLEVQNAEVNHAGKRGSSIGYRISFDTQCDHEQYDDDIKISLTYSEELSNGSELDQMKEAIEIIEDTPLGDSTNYI